MKKLYDRMIEGENPKFAIVSILIIGLVSIFFLPWILTRSCISISDYSETGSIGDTIGGISTPIIALLASILTFMAFWVQMKANKAQTLQFSKIDNDSKLERFQTRFHELLKFHKENTQEFKLGKSNGRRIFLPLVKEFTFCYHTIQLVYDAKKELNTLDIELSKEQLMDIAYIVFFIGIGSDSKKLFDPLTSEYGESIIEDYIKALKSQVTKYHPSQYLQVPYSKKSGYYSLQIAYTPFQGHVSRLGHYYRHLFQLTKFVVNQDPEIVTNRYEYIKIIRAQLSNHEQILLYFNGMSRFGKEWISNGYFTKYRMIKNIPLPMIDFGKTPTEKFGVLNDNDEYIFEWDKNSLN